MANIFTISTADKIVLLEYIKKNYDRYESVWPREKVEYLSGLIDGEIVYAADFDVESAKTYIDVKPIV